MVIEGLIGAVLGVVNAILVTILPEGGTLGLEGGTGFILGYSAFNVGLPLAEMITCLGIYVSAVTVIFAVRAFTFVYNLIPFKGT